MVNKTTLKFDLSAGLTNAVVVLPQGVAFAMIAGLPPIYGLYTAMIVPIVAALFGSSWQLISGPTTAISIVVFSEVSQFASPGTESFIALAFVLTFIAGVIQLLIGIARLGTLVNFVSNSVVIGFTAGAAFLIATSQFKHILGIFPPVGSSFFETWRYFALHINETNYYVLSIAMVTLLSAIVIKRIFPKSPHLLIGMIVGSLFAYLFANGVDSVVLVGKLPSKLPSFQFPQLTGKNVTMLLSSGFAVAMLGLIEAVAIARSIATKTKQNLDGNQEFIGQGMSNIIGSMFMSYAGSGSFTRSGINYQSGAKTPLSAIFAGISLGLILLIVAPLTAYLPIAAMGGIILLVAIKLVDVKYIFKVNKSSKRELIVLFVTFLSTLFLHLEFAIYIGVILSLVFYLQQSSKPSIVSLSLETPLNSINIEILAKDEKLIKAIRINGPLFFGATDHVRKTLDKIKDEGVKNILIVGNGINFIDISGAELLINQADKLRLSGGRIYLCGLNDNVRKYLAKGGHLEKFGNENVFSNMDTAILEINKHLLD